ncbi:MAG: MBL fold metallo-hydrolase [Nocardioidaceae bacterium]
MSDAADGRLIVLGSSGAWPEAGRACSCFVVEFAGTRVVLDLGYGTIGPLLSHLGNSAGDGIDAVVITHHHPDHAVDLHGLFRARLFGRPGGPPGPLYAPEGVLRLMATIEDDAEDAILTVFDWHPLPGPAATVGAFTLTAFEVPHFVPAVGVRLEADGLVLAYTGDTGPSPVLEDLGRDADLYIVEATDRYQQPGAPPAPPGPALHLDSIGAGAVALRAGARRLMLTHFWPGNDRELSRAQARQEFGGEVLLAEEGLTVALP